MKRVLSFFPLKVKPCKWSCFERKKAIIITLRIKNFLLKDEMKILNEQYERMRRL